MQQSKLNLEKINSNIYRAMFKTLHGRVIYVEIMINNNNFEITDCFYADRNISVGKRSFPLKLKTKVGKLSNLLYVFETELDKKFYGITFHSEKCNLSTEEYISNFYEEKFKYRFLILVKDGDSLKTRFKNKNHRSIYLELCLKDEKCTITQCHYYDRKYKRDNALITPHGLTSISFDYGLDKLLIVINNELCGNFTNVIITDNTFGFEYNSIPICGCI